MNNAIDQLFRAREEIQRLKIENAKLEHELDKAVAEIRILSDKLEAINAKYPQYTMDDNEYFVRCK